MANQYVWNEVLENGLHVFATQVPNEVAGSLILFGGPVYAIVSPSMLTGSGCSISQQENDVYITVGGSGPVVAVGSNNTVVAPRGVVVRGNVSGSIITGSGNRDW